jgi:hypothetical protein
MCGLYYMYTSVVVATYRQREDDTGEPRWTAFSGTAPSPARQRPTASAAGQTEDPIQLVRAANRDRAVHRRSPRQPPGARRCSMRHRHWRMAGVAPQAPAAFGSASSSTAAASSSEHDPSVASCPPTLCHARGRPGPSSTVVAWSSSPTKQTPK